MRHPVIAFIGVIGSGKDYNANLNFKSAGTAGARIDFKDELIDMCSDIAGYDVRADYDWFKEHPVGVMRPADPLQEAFLHSEWKDILRRHPEIITGRKLLTRVGTEAIRKRHPNYWVDSFLARAENPLKAGGSVFNSDCRFSNEVETLMGLSAKFTFCDYRSNRYDPKFDHDSEKLAQTLLWMGCKDGHDITADDFTKAFKRIGSPFNPLKLRFI